MTIPRLNNYLRTHRKRSGLTQQEVAVLLGCRHGSKVSRYERGERCPSLETLIAYEVIFSGNSSELFSGMYNKIREAVFDRAMALHRVLDSEENFTPILKRKMEFLMDMIYENGKEA